MNNTIYDNAETARHALECARGTYQEELALGQAQWSGADLEGRARTYSARYRDSRVNLIARWRATGLGVELRPDGPNRKLICYVNGGE
jgi:hypothetical protein